MRKLCTDEAGGVKMKKHGKKKGFIIRKNVFLYCSFSAAPLALQFKDDL
jgi:hypothetical protein